MSSRVLRWLIDTVWLLRRYRPVEPTVTVTLTLDTTKFVAAMRDMQRALERGLSQDWPRCPGDGINPKMHEFWIPLGYACPSCKAAL